jgi:hypothetical protein
MLQRRSGEDRIVRVDRPSRWLDHDEVATRLYRNLRGYEIALYFYDGYWKSPGGMDPGTGRSTFPKLTVYGASARGAALGGIAHVEAGYYDSREDRNGDNSSVANGEFRFLVGLEREVGSDLTATLQYYIEHMLDHASYLHTLPAGITPADETRHTLTLRLRQLLLRQDLELGIFVRWSPSDNDAYFRPKASYKLSDAWRIEVGGNFFTGHERHTFLNQFSRNNSLYAAARYSF